MNARPVRNLLLIVCVFTASHTWGGEKLLFAERDTVVASLGSPVQRVEHPRAARPTMDVQQFRKEGREYIIYFETDRADRIIVSKQDGTTFSDKEINELLLPNKSFNSWSRWDLPDRRAWISDGKIGPFFALVSSNGRSLELITARYLRHITRQEWLDSTEPLQAKQP